MNIFKKILAVILSVSLLLTLLCACKKDDGAGEQSALPSDADSSEHSSAEGSSSEDSGIASSAESSESGEYSSANAVSSEDSSATGDITSSTAESTASPNHSSADDSSALSSSADSSQPPVQDSSAPDISSSAPDSSVPDSSVPDSSAPDVSSSAPDSSAPDSSAPDSSIPDSSVSDSSIPDSSAPDSSVWESSASSEDSSFEESSAAPEIPADPTTPRTPLPEALYADPIDSFFDDSVFIGYSIMMHFGKYVSQWRTEVDSSVMGDAIFCAAVGISFHADATQTPDTPDTTLPLFRGEHYNFADLPAATGSDTIYIGLPVYSDLKWAGSSSTAVDEAYRSTVAGIKRIRAKNPNLNIVLLSGTYNSGIYDGLSYKWQNNGKVLEYNNRVLDYCNENGIDFIDVATPLTDYRGFFVADYATDGEYHIKKEAYQIWVAILRDYATGKQNGTWQNITEMPSLPYFE